jgi:hypothetical protein
MTVPVLHQVGQPRVIDPDEERATDSRPALHTGQRHDVPVVGEAGVPWPRPPAVGTGVQVERVLAASCRHQPPARAVRPQLIDVHPLAGVCHGESCLSVGSGFVHALAGSLGPRGAVHVVILDPGVDIQGLLAVDLAADRASIVARMSAPTGSALC